MLRHRLSTNFRFLIFSIIGVLFLFLITACNGSSAIPEDFEIKLGDDFAPVSFPQELGIPEFQFPEDQTTIDNWVATNDFASIYLHGWGIWAGLTADSGEIFEDQSLRVFETWYTPQDILCITNLKPSDCPTEQRVANPLGALNQLEKNGLDDESTVEGFVKYDPTAAEHIIDEQLFNKQHLQTLLDDGNNKIPDFPNTAISLKPVFVQLSCSPNCSEPLVSVTNDGRFAQLRIWPGSDQSCSNAPDECFPASPNPNGFPSSEWPDCVWIDMAGESNSADSSPSDCSNASPQSAFNIDDFIWFRDSSSGNFAVLVGMHVTSREITRWTWQSFWWTPTPDSPHHPSSEEIADTRPSQLVAPASNYAMSIGYSMVLPAQSETGGQSSGESIYSFNPYLEAGFNETAVPLPIMGSYTYEGVSVPNNVGVETNCMSCHIQATLSGDLQYSGDQYIDLNGSEFDNELKLDFLWSIQANAVDPPTD